MATKCTKCGSISGYSTHGRCLNCGNQQFQSTTLINRHLHGIGAGKVSTQFDKDGMTTTCPQTPGREIFFQDCEACSRFISSIGFTVYCKKN